MSAEEINHGCFGRNEADIECTHLDVVLQDEDSFDAGEAACVEDKDNDAMQGE